MRPHKVRKSALHKRFSTESSSPSEQRDTSRRFALGARDVRLLAVKTLRAPYHTGIAGMRRTNSYQRLWSYDYVWLCMERGRPPPNLRPLIEYLVLALSVLHSCEGVFSVSARARVEKSSLLEGCGLTQQASQVPLHLLLDKILKVAIISSCEIEDFVEASVCKLCVILRSRLPRGVFVLMENIGR